MMKRALLDDKLQNERNPHVYSLHKELFHLQIPSYHTKLFLYCGNINQDDLDPYRIQ